MHPSCCTNRYGVPAFCGTHKTVVVSSSSSLTKARICDWRFASVAISQQVAGSHVLFLLDAWSFFRSEMPEKEISVFVMPHSQNTPPSRICLAVLWWFMAFVHKASGGRRNERSMHDAAYDLGRTLLYFHKIGRSVRPDNDDAGPSTTTRIFSSDA